MKTRHFVLLLVAMIVLAVVGVLAKHGQQASDPIVVVESVLPPAEPVVEPVLMPTPMVKPRPRQSHPAPAVHLEQGVERTASAPAAPPVASSEAILAMVVTPRWCGGAYDPVRGSNFAPCREYTAVAQVESPGDAAAAADSPGDAGASSGGTGGGGGGGGTGGGGGGAGCK